MKQASAQLMPHFINNYWTYQCCDYVLF